MNYFDGSDQLRCATTCSARTTAVPWTIGKKRSPTLMQLLRGSRTSNTVHVHTSRTQQLVAQRYRVHSRRHSTTISMS